MECLICLQLQQLTDFTQICQDDRHTVCENCFLNIVDKSICCFCRQINPHYYQQSSESHSLIEQFGFVSGSQYSDEESESQQEDSSSEYEPWTLRDQLSQDVVQFTIPLFDRNAMQSAIRLLEALISQSRVQTRSMVRRMEEHRRNQ